MKKIITIVGARPQFVKAAVVSRAIIASGELEELIVHTGQHFDGNMSKVFFDEMEIPKPAFNLNINSVGHAAMTGRMMEKIEELLLEIKPNAVLVYGDTNSTLAGALAAKKIHVPVAHVEAGLRSFDMQMPEEINRILSDRISNVLFCPTDTAISNLKKEGYDNFKIDIVKSGDVMLDAAKYYAKKSNTKAQFADGIQHKAFVLCTLHRAENTDNPKKLKSIVDALNKLHLQIPVVMPLHPRTAKIIKQMRIDLKVQTIPPVGYFDMIELLKKCSLVVTDSGGLQKEAYFFEKNCVTLRDNTEWVELLQAGANELANALEVEEMVAKMQQMLSKTTHFNENLYGNGKAGEIIVNYLKTAF